MRRDEDFFGTDEPFLVYIAKKLREALAVEDLLTNGGVDYLVEPDKYKGGFLFPMERIGAFFYVAGNSLDRTRELLRSQGYKPYQME